MKLRTIAVAVTLSAAAALAGCSGEGGGISLPGGINLGGDATPGSQCTTYDGPNPSADEWKHIRAEYAQKRVALDDKYGSPARSDDQHMMIGIYGGRPLASELQAVEMAPAGSFEEYTKMLCGSTGDFNPEDLKAITEQANQSLEALKSNPDYASVDWDGFARESQELDQRYPELYASGVLFLCGTIRDSPDASGLDEALAASNEAIGGGGDITRKGMEIICPDLVDELPAATSPATPPLPAAPTLPANAPTSLCTGAVVNGMTGSVTVKGIYSCANAKVVVNESLTTLAGSGSGDKNGRYTINGINWECGILGAAEAERQGFDYTCSSTSGKPVALQWKRDNATAATTNPPAQQSGRSCSPAVSLGGLTGVVTITKGSISCGEANLVIISAHRQLGSGGGYYKGGDQSIWVCRTSAHTLADIREYRCEDQAKTLDFTWNAT